MTRLVQDITNRKLYELPDYVGNPAKDILLIELCENLCTCTEKCQHPNVQIGEPHMGNMMVIDDDTWKKRRDHIIKEVWSAFPDMQDEDISQSLRNNYREDASVCFNRHNRPTDGCIDYKDDSKRIGSPTKHPWLAEQAPVYLCDFCVVKSWVQTQVFHERGLYK